MSSNPIRYCSAANGMSIAWTSIGEGAPVVFSAMIFALEMAFEKDSHGSMWPLVAKGRRLVAYDGLGSGLSDRSFEDFSVEQSVRRGAGTARGDARGLRGRRRRPDSRLPHGQCHLRTPAGDACGAGAGHRVLPTGGQCARLRSLHARAEGGGRLQRRASGTVPDPGRAHSRLHANRAFAAAALAFLDEASGGSRAGDREGARGRVRQSVADRRFLATCRARSGWWPLTPA